MQYVNGGCSNFLTQNVMHPSMSSPRGWGFGHRVGILTFSKKIIKFPTPGQKIIVESISNKWFTPHPGDTHHSQIPMGAQPTSGLTLIGA